MTDKNKILYGLENVHYAPIVSEDPITGAIEYGPVKPLLGGVDLAIEPKGEPIVVKADNTDYFIMNSNEGYSGTMTLVLLPETFETEILGEVINSETGVITESSTPKSKGFALMWQFEGDQNPVRFVMYKCTASRPKIASKTKDGSDVNRTELTFDSTPRKDKIIKRKTSATVKQNVFDNWFTEVYDEQAK